MSNPDEVPYVNNVKASKIKLLLFGGMIVAMAASFTVSGFLRRDEIRELGGPLHVSIRNDAEYRLRTDLFIGDQHALLELDSKQSAMVRFSPKEQAAIEINVYRKNNPTKALSHGTFEPGERRNLQFVLLSDTDLKIEELPLGDE